MIIKKLILGVCLVILVVSLFGCTQQKVTTTPVNSSDLDKDLKELNDLEEELDFSELDQIDQDLKDLEN